MKRDVCFPWPVTDLARHSQNGRLSLVLIHRAGSVVHPSVVALHAARRRLASEIVTPFAIEARCRPLAGRMQPTHRQLADLIAAPREVDLIRFRLGTEHEINGRVHTLLTTGRIPNGCLKVLAIGLGHLESNRRFARMRRTTSRLKALGHVANTGHHTGQKMPCRTELFHAFGMTREARLRPEIAVRIRDRPSLGW